MNVEEYLNQVKNIDLRVRSLAAELNDTEAENDSEYAEELQGRIKSDIARFKKIKMQIREEIQQIDDNKYCVLLTEYYIRGRSWEQVAQALEMKDTKNVRTGMKRRALAAFRKKFFQKFQKQAL